MMKYDELIKELREAGKFAKSAWANPYRFVPYYFKAANAIEELQKENENISQNFEVLIQTNKIQGEKISIYEGVLQKWIPVAERLPEENTKVLIVTERRNVIYGTFADGLFSDDWQYYTPDYVVWWMYIPKPPKEET